MKPGREGLGREARQRPAATDDPQASVFSVNQSRRLKGSRFTDCLFRSPGRPVDL